MWWGDGKASSNFAPRSWRTNQVCLEESCPPSFRGVAAHRDFVFPRLVFFCLVSNLRAQTNRSPWSCLRGSSGHLLLPWLSTLGSYPCVFRWWKGSPICAGHLFVARLGWGKGLAVCRVVEQGRFVRGGNAQCGESTLLPPLPHANTISDAPEVATI